MLLSLLLTCFLDISMPKRIFDPNSQALQALVAQSNPPPQETGEVGPEWIEPQGPPEPPRQRANWLMHAANLGTAGYDAYQTDKLRKWNEEKAGDVWVGFKPGEQPSLSTARLSITPKLPIAMMGSNPSQGRVYGQTLGLAALQSLAAHFMPKKIGNVSLGIGAVGNLASGGVKQWAHGKVKSTLDDVRKDMFDLGVKVPPK